MTAFDRLENALVAALRVTLATSKSVRLPDAGRLIWEWFVDLTESRTYHANGPNPISYGEIADYARINQWNIQPRHVAIIRAMDAAYIADFYSKRERETSGVKTIKKPSGTITPDLFDAVF